MNRGPLALIILFSILTLMFAACAPKLVPAGFVPLGRAEIGFSTKRAVVPVPPTAPPVKRLIVLALINDIDFTHVRVEFANGTSFEHGRRAILSPSRDSLVLDLPGERRKVREVIVQYQNVRQTARRAVVEIWGDPR